MDATAIKEPNQSRVRVFFIRLAHGTERMTVIEQQQVKARVTRWNMGMMYHLRSFERSMLAVQKKTLLAKETEHARKRTVTTWKMQSRDLRNKKI